MSHNCLNVTQTVCTVSLYPSTVPRQIFGNIRDMILNNSISRGCFVTVYVSKLVIAICACMYRKLTGRHVPNGCICLKKHMKP